MESSIVHVQKWSKPKPPTEADLWQTLESNGLTPFRWVNQPNVVYMPHKHPYLKIVYVVSGSIVFGFPIDGPPIMLNAGDRLELPANLLHNAVVGDNGVVCLEVHQYSD